MSRLPLFACRRCGVLTNLRYRVGISGGTRKRKVVPGDRPGYCASCTSERIREMNDADRAAHRAGHRTP
jgi:hypothetical protein